MGFEGLFAHRLASSICLQDCISPARTGSSAGFASAILEITVVRMMPRQAVLLHEEMAKHNLWEDGLGAGVAFFQPFQLAQHSSLGILIISSMGSIARTSRGIRQRAFPPSATKLPTGLAARGKGASSGFVAVAAARSWASTFTFERNSAEVSPRPELEEDLGEEAAEEVSAAARWPRRFLFLQGGSRWA